MSDNINYYNTEDEEIDLRGLFYYVCKKWRTLLLFLIIGALIGCLISYIKMDKGGAQSVSGAAVRALEENREALVDQYAEYLNLLENTAARADDSVILNMDPTAVYTGKLSYYVTCKNDDVDRIEALADTMLSRDGNWEKIYKASGLDCSMAAFKELVTVDFCKPENKVLERISTDIEASSSAGSDRPTILNYDNTSNSHGGYLEITIVCPTEENLQPVMTAMKQIAEEALKDYSGEFDGMSFIQLNNETGFGYSEIVAEAQSKFAKIKKEYTDEITLIGSTLTDDERSYYTAKYKTTGDGAVAVSSGTGFSKKWPIIGAAVMFFLCALWYALKYILSDRIKSEDEFGAQYGLKVFGSVKLSDDGKTGLDRWLNKLDSSRSVEPVSEEYISSIIKGLEADSIALIEATPCDKEKETADKLATMDDRLVDAGCILTNNSTVSKLVDSDGVIIIAKLGKIRRQEMVRILELVQKFGKQVLGVVVIR